MTRHIKIAIVGAGFCGLAVAWHLANHPLFSTSSIYLFDSKKIGGGTSGIAAGLLHPFAGAHAKLNWKGMEGFQATVELLNSASQALGKPTYAQDNGILRLALSSEQEADYQLCARRYPSHVEWLSENKCQQLAPLCTKAPGIWIKGGLTVYSASYLEGLWLACERRGVRFEQRKIQSLKELKDFSLQIFTTGGETSLFPEFSKLPLHIVKGQVLEFAWPADLPPLSCAINSQAYVLMTESKQTCLAGATYERDFSHLSSHLDSAQAGIMPKACALLPLLQDLLVINCYAGIRSVTADHLPFLYSPQPHQWILAGMGSKGLLYHALMAKELVERMGH